VDRYCLIGRGIAHSRSPEIYRTLLRGPFIYDLLDVASVDELPSAETLAARYRGVNVTAPYKQHYAAWALPAVKRLGAVNCLRFRDGRPGATNTDYLAMRHLVRATQAEAGAADWIVLGDGAMARTTIAVLSELGLPWRQCARRLGHDLAALGLAARGAPGSVSVVVNTCAREYVFQQSLPSGWLFWNLNYAHRAQDEVAKQLGFDYRDGFALLKLQAEEAVKFWEFRG